MSREDQETQWRAMLKKREQVGRNRGKMYIVEIRG